MVVQDNKRDCCGCTACMNVCPQNCITMITDDLGFQYPQIDEKKCVHCNLCKTTCAFGKVIESKDNDFPRVYAAKNKSEDIHEKSSSGGMFIPLSDWILQNKGVVYGAGYSDDFMVTHKRAVNEEQRDEFVGSKYVQSDMKQIFSDVENDLKLGKEVLFTGTACQVHGLLSYLNRKKCNTDKLYTIDIVCHGVPSPKMWREFLKEIQKIGQLDKLTFTSKEIVNELKGLKCTFKDHSPLLTGFYWTSYGKMFLKNYILRDSCYNCPYTSPYKRYADITLGDYWGLDKVLPEFCHQKGISLLMVHTLKGEKMFQQIIDRIDYRETDVQDCLQPNLKEPSKLPKNRDAFLKRYCEKGYQKAYHMICPDAFGAKLKRIKRRISGKIIGSDF